MERIHQGRSATLTHTFEVDGVATNPSPDSATVEITRADGTALVPAGSVTDGGVGVVSLTLTPAETALLDTLEVTWTASFGGQAQEFTDFVEVAGGFLFTISELSADLGTSTTTYTVAQIADARTYAETQLERECGAAFVPRYELETLSGNGSSTLILRWPNIRSIRSVTVDGTAYTGDQLATLAFNPSGIVTNQSGWSCAQSIVIGYEHGYQWLNPGASEAALVLAKHKLVKGPIDERATQRASEFGPVNLATPGMFGSRFGIPVVDAFIVANNMNVGVA